MRRLFLIPMICLLVGAGLPCSADETNLQSGRQRPDSERTEKLAPRPADESENRSNDGKGRSDSEEAPPAAEHRESDRFEGGSLGRPFRNPTNDDTIRRPLPLPSNSSLQLESLRADFNKLRDEVRQMRLGITAASGGSDVPARRVHFLVFALENDPKIGSGASANRQFLSSFATQMRGFFNSSEATRVNLIVQRDFSQSLLNSAFDSLSDVTADDTIFCHISTHGGFDPVQGHVLQQSNGSLVTRKAIWAKLASRKTRQTVLVTDSCANNITAPAMAPESATIEQLPYSLYYLLFTAKGEVNMNGCAPPELSWYRTSSDQSGGGIFTRAFIRTGVEDSAATWSDFLTKVRVVTNQETSAAPGAQRQTPTLFNSEGQAQ